MNGFDPTTPHLRPSFLAAMGLGSFANYLARAEQIFPDLFSGLSEETVAKALKIIEFAESNDYLLKQDDPRAFAEKVIKMGSDQGINPHVMHNIAHLWCQMKADESGLLSELGWRKIELIQKQIFASFPTLTPRD